MAKSPSCLTCGLRRANPPEECDGCDGSHWATLTDTLHQLCCSVIYSKKCSTYWLSQIDDLLCWLYRHRGEKWRVFVEMRSLHSCTDVGWDPQASYCVCLTYSSWRCAFAAHVSSSLCYPDIWVLSMINLSYVLYRTSPNLYSAGSTKSFHSPPVREVVSRTECSHARKLCQGLLWMD